MKYKLEKPVHGSIGNEKYQCTIEWRNGLFIADEPATLGGKDVGPDPYTLLLSSLVTCTLVTIKMYMDKKGWEISRVTVNANMYQETIEGKRTTIIDRDIIFPEETEEEQKTKLFEMAQNCPISKILSGDIHVRTFQFKNGDVEKKLKYTNDEITVVWKPEFCQHAARCWKELPEVFDYNKRPWINPNGATSEEIIRQINKCPSGALSYHLNSKEEK
jgi:putative redox protein